MAEPNVAGGVLLGGSGSSSTSVGGTAISGKWAIDSSGVKKLKTEVDALRDSFRALKQDISSLSTTFSTLSQLSNNVGKVRVAMAGAAAGGSSYGSVGTGSSSGNGMVTPPSSWGRSGSGLIVPPNTVNVPPVIPPAPPRGTVTPAGDPEGESGGGGGGGKRSSMNWLKAGALDTLALAGSLGGYVNSNMNFIVNRDLTNHQLSYTTSMPYVSGTGTGSSRRNMEDWMKSTIGAQDSGYSKDGGLQAVGMVTNFGYGAGNRQSADIINQGGGINQLLGTNDATGIKALDQMNSAATNLRARQLFGVGTIKVGGGLGNLAELANSVYSSSSGGKSLNQSRLNEQLGRNGGVNQNLERNFGDSPEMNAAIKQILSVEANKGKDLTPIFADLGAGGARGKSAKAALQKLGFSDSIFGEKTKTSAAQGDLLANSDLAGAVQRNQKLMTDAVEKLNKVLADNSNLSKGLANFAAAGAAFSGAIKTLIGALVGMKLIKAITGDAAAGGAGAAGGAALLGGTLTVAGALGGIKAGSAIGDWAGKKLGGKHDDSHDLKFLGANIQGIPDAYNGAKKGLNWITKGWGDAFGGPKNGTDAAGQGNGQTYTQIEAMASGVPNRVTSTLRGTHATNSLHYRGDAVDFGEPSGPSQDSPGLLAINKYFAQKYGSQLSELIYAGPGGINIKNGKKVDGNSFYGAATMAEHHNHVHVGITPDRLGLAAGPIGIMNGDSGAKAAVGGNTNQDAKNNSGNDDGGGGTLANDNDLISSTLNYLSQNVGAGTRNSRRSERSGISTAGNVGSVGQVGSMPEGNALSNARIILQVAKQMGVSKRGAIIGIATAEQESNLINLHSGDRDSQGLFQQRPSQGWGTVAQVTNPAYASHSFFERLKGTDYEHLPLTVAAQKVQRSGFPDAYAKWEKTATEIVNKVGYAQGSWEIEKDQTARIHRGEMIIPAKEAEAVRSAAKSSSGSSGGHGNTFNNTFNITANGSSESEANRLAHQVMEIMERQTKFKAVMSR
jgi:hypothetical protein